MSSKGLVSALLLGISAAIFVPVFVEAGSSINFGSWLYASEASLIVNNIPIILAAGVLLILVTAMEAQLE